MMTALFSSAPIFADAAYVTVDLNNGSTYSYLLSESPKISYKNDSLLVRGTVLADFPLNQVISYRFTESDLTSIQDLKSKECRITYLGGNQVKVEGLDGNSPVAIYSATGIVLQKSNASPEGVAELTLPQTKGVYILKTNTQSVKLVNE